MTTDSRTDLEVPALGRASHQRRLDKALLREWRRLVEDAARGLVTPPVERPLDVVVADEHAARVLWNADELTMRVRAPAGWLDAPSGESGPPDLPVDDGWADLSVAVGSVSRCRPEVARHVLRELWRVTRPAGRMVVIDDFVRGGQPGSPAPLDMRQFLHLLAEASAMRVALHSITSFRHPGEDLRRGAAVVAVRVGGMPR